MWDMRDVGIVGAVFVGSILVVLLFFLATASSVSEREESLRTQSVQRLAGGETVVAVIESQERPAIRTLVLGDEQNPAAFLVELSVTGYRGRIRLMARLAPDGDVQDLVLLAESEGPSYDRLLRDSASLQAAVEAALEQDEVGISATPEAVSGATYAVMRIAEGILTAQRSVRER
mgnify:CR=1 FL=1